METGIRAAGHVPQVAPEVRELPLQRRAADASDVVGRGPWNERIVRGLEEERGGGGSGGAGATPRSSAGAGCAATRGAGNR